MSDVIDTIDIIKNKLSEIGMPKDKFVYLIRSSPITFEKVMNRTTNIDIDILYRIACAIDMPPEELVENEYKYRKEQEKSLKHTEKEEIIANMYRIIAERKLVPEKSDLSEIIQIYKSFMEIGHLDCLKSQFGLLEKYNLNYEEKIAILTWMQIAIRKSREIKFNSNIDSNEKMKDRLSLFKEKIANCNIEFDQLRKELIGIYADYNVFLNIEEVINSCKIISFGKILNNGNIVIQISKTEDINDLFEKAISEYYILTQMARFGEKNIHFTF